MARFLLIFFVLAFGKLFGQTADFSFKTPGGVFCAPATIQFSQTCSGQPVGFIWTFGATKRYEEDPEFTYTNAGTYTVTLTAIYENTVSTVNKIITINPGISISLKADQVVRCQPGTVGFTVTPGSDSLIATYNWDFDDSSEILATTAPHVTHAFVDYGNYKIAALATSIDGCTIAKTVTLKVQKPTISVRVNQSGNCIPATVKFTASAKLPTGSKVEKYLWNFGDSTTVATTVPTISKNYSLTGYYHPSLTIVSADGCTASTAIDAIGFGTPPYNLQAYADNNIFCASEKMIFHSVANDATEYVWEFGDGTTIIDTLESVSHQYRKLGQQTVQVVPSFNGCEGESKNLLVDVKGVVAAYNYSNTCTARQAYEFENTSLGDITKTAWVFSGGLSQQDSYNASQHFPANGNYTTELQVYDSVSGCADSLSRTFYTAVPAMMVEEGPVCKNQLVTFTLSDTYNNSRARYTWQVLGKTIAGDQDSLAVSADSLGSFSNSVIINYDRNSCPDTISLDKKILVRGPKLDFTIITPACLKKPFSVINKSKPFVPGDSIVINAWAYNVNARTDTVYQPANFLNTKTGKYAVTLYATDLNGCSDSLKQFYTVNRIPFVNVLEQWVSLCSGQSVSLIAYHSDSLTWSPAANISCAGCDTIVARPASSGKLYATAINSYGCSVTDSVDFVLAKPFTASTNTADIYICENDSIQLDVDPKDKIVHWEPALGLSSTEIFSPVASPPASTTYTATLTDSLGCYSSSVTRNVVVKTLPTVDAGPDKVYPYYANFVIEPIYSRNVKTYEWWPREILQCFNCANPKGVATESHTYQVAVTSDSGCIANDSVNISVQCSAENLLMPGAFTPNNDNLNDVYYPITRGVKTIVRFAVYNRFGQLMYEAKDFPPNEKKFGWDGTLGGRPQPFSNYVYVLEAICDLGDRLQKKDNFVLLR